MRYTINKTNTPAKRNRLSPPSVSRWNSHHSMYENIIIRWGSNYKRHKQKQGTGFLALVWNIYTNYVIISVAEGRPHCFPSVCVRYRFIVPTPIVWAFIFTAVIWTAHENSDGKNIQARASPGKKCYTGAAEKKLSVRVREAATDKRITPLLSTPGDVTPEQGNAVKKGKTLISLAPSWYGGQRLGLSDAGSLQNSAQRHVFPS